jgi:hypothetical protein
MKIEVEIHQKYGKPRFYPRSDDAHFLAKLIDKPTLTATHLEMCNGYGWEVEIKAPKYELKQFLKGIE